MGPSRPAAPPTLPGPDARTIAFSGREWVVRPAGRSQSPGPNDWSDDPTSVWVDERGLHLVIRRQGGTWRSVELSTALPPDAAHVSAILETPLDDLDPRAVAALFVYRDDQHEADIELSRWGQRHRFRLAGDLSPTEHVLDWRADRVAFHSRSAERVLQEWRHTDAQWTERDGYRLFVNLWLYQGRAPLRRAKPRPRLRTSGANSNSHHSDAGLADSLVSQTQPAGSTMSMSEAQSSSTVRSQSLSRPSQTSSNP